jgi:hypothetical protein
MQDRFYLFIRFNAFAMKFSSIFIDGDEYDVSDFHSKSNETFLPSKKGEAELDLHGFRM